jgi:hypothetical protein
LCGASNRHRRDKKQTQNLVAKHEKSLLVGWRHRWKDDIKMDLNTFSASLK